MLRSTLNASQIPECTTNTCIQLGQSLSDYINYDVDPCNDFYQYACGNWIKHASIPDGRVDRSTFSDINQQNSLIIQGILEQSYEDLLQQDMTAGQFTSTTEDREMDKTMFETIQRFYHSCMDLDTLNELGPSPIYNQLSTLVRIMPNSDDEAAAAARIPPQFVVQNKDDFFVPSPTPLRMKFLTDLVIQAAEEGTSPLITFDVVPNDANPKEYAIVISQPGLTLGSKRYYTEPERLAAYQEGLVDFVTRVLAPDKQIWIDKAHQVDLQLHKNREQTRAMVQRAVEVETKIASIVMETVDLMDPMKRHNPVTLEALATKYPIIDWQHYLRHFIPDDVDVPEKVIVYAPSYLEQLAAWITQDNQVSDQALKDYFLMHLMFRWIAALDTKTQKLLQKVYGKVKTGNSNLRSREHICVARTNIGFGHLVGRYFVMKSFGGDDKRAHFDDLVTNIHNTWIESVTALEWLDESTRKEALDKLGTLRHFLGYNTISPDIRSPSSLQSHYRTLHDAIHDSNDDFYANEIAIAHFLQGQRWMKVGKPADQNDWRIVYPYTGNAFQIRPLNAIVIPAGILQHPIYDADTLASINYGTIGVLIGHELTHAFDDTGRLFDSHGQLRQWWTNHTSKMFDEKAQCFIDQYNQFKVIGPNDEEANVNGKLTLCENVADNGGLAVAYKSLQGLWADDALTKSELDGYIKLPHSELSPEQLFFFGAARTWCAKSQPQYALHRAYTDPHAPPEVRVNAAMQNFPPFAEAFQCPVGSPMNPKKKCTIW